MPLGQAPLVKFEDEVRLGIKDEEEAIDFYEGLIERTYYITPESKGRTIRKFLEQILEQEKDHLGKLQGTLTALRL